MVLIGFLAALFANRDGSLSSIHRHMTKWHSSLCPQLGVPCTPCISRAQLPLLLGKTDRGVLGGIISSISGLPNGAEEWFSIDGKDLRGSIAKGDSRGMAVVGFFAHSQSRILLQSFYSGKKESEVILARQMLSLHGLWSRNLALDALHLNPTTLKLSQDAQGTYLVGLKDNQPEMLAEAKRWLPTLPVLARTGACYEKGHGRVDGRAYTAYDMSGIYMDERWEGCGLSTLVVVERERRDMKTGHDSREEAYFVSNLSLKVNPGCLFKAVRGHWGIEAYHNVKDCTLREDGLRSLKEGVQKISSDLRGMVVNLLKKLEVKNMKAQLEAFSDDFYSLITILTKERIL